MTHLRRPRSFTLVEVLLALAIVVLLSAAMLSLLFNLGRRRTAMVRLASDQQAVGVFLDRLEADLSAALAGDAGLGAGIKGTATELFVLTRGVDLGESAGGSARALGDLQGCRYTFDRQTGVLRARRSPAGRGTGEGGEFEVVSSRLRRVRLRYFDGREWRPAFDSLERRGLPVVVECAVWTGDPPADPESERWGAPDRLRVIVVPDGPLAAWREER